MCMCACGDDVSLKCHSSDGIAQVTTILFFKIGSLIRTWGSPMRLDWLANKPQRASFLYFFKGLCVCDTVPSFRA